MEVPEKHAFIAIKKYGDAYIKLKSLGDIFTHNYRYPSNVWIIDSRERNELINTNVSISKVIAIYMQPIDITLLKIYFVYQRDKYYEEQLVIVCREAIDAMKKANLFDDLFID